MEPHARRVGQADAGVRVDEALAVARRQLWLRAGSAKDEQLTALARERLTERDGRFAFEWTPTKIGILSWSPASS